MTSDSDDDELKDFLVGLHEDFQASTGIHSTESQDILPTINVVKSGDTCRTFSSPDTGGSLSTYDCARGNVPVAESMPTGNRKKVSRGTSLDVELAQSIAKSRLRDFNISSGWNRSSFTFGPTTSHSVSDTAGQQFADKQKHQTVPAPVFNDAR